MITIASTKLVLYAKFGDPPYRASHLARRQFGQGEVQPSTFASLTASLKSKVDHLHISGACSALTSIHRKSCLPAGTTRKLSSSATKSQVKHTVIWPVHTRAQVKNALENSRSGGRARSGPGGRGGPVGWPVGGGVLLARPPSMDNRPGVHSPPALGKQGQDH